MVHLACKPEAGNERQPEPRDTSATKCPPQSSPAADNDRVAAGRDCSSIIGFGSRPFAAVWGLVERPPSNNAKSPTACRASSRLWLPTPSRGQLAPSHGSEVTGASSVSSDVPGTWSMGLWLVIATCSLSSSEEVGAACMMDVTGREPVAIT